ncbi:MAG TPA: AAA family ATPase [Gammaproteobacteria bacterium]|nr:AAA family ATPase [Gammaproteobacteria bacterium]
MRLERLDLTRYGVFTDGSIRFERPAHGESDFHVVYGPNEAGKSTLLSAFLDLLFGIETRSRYDFLHPYSTMRVGGILEIAGARHALVRIKRAQNGLLDGNDQPLPEGILLGALGGVDRDAYTTMFSLDDETIESGGESILASRGDLGQLLFSASAGLADFDQALEELRSEADRFYRPRARSCELTELKRRLSELKGEREHLDTLASEYARLVETRDRAGELYDKALAERGAIQSRREALQRQLAALPRLRALREIRDRLRPLADLPEAPLEWVEDLPRLQQQDTELATLTEHIEADINSLTGRVEAIVVDRAALGLAESIDRLAELRARYLTAEKDLPERRMQLTEADLAISAILRRLEREAETDPRALLLSASSVGAIRELIESRSGIETALHAAESELAEARDRLALARAGLAAAGGRALSSGSAGDASIPMLMSAVSAATADDHAARRNLAERSRREYLDVLCGRLASLRPWTGDPDELLELTVPRADDIERWRTSLSAAQAALDRHTGELEIFVAEERRLGAEIGAISAAHPSDDAAASTRAEREAAWARHKRTLERASAEAFEIVLRRDDIVTNARVSGAAEAAKLNQAQQRLRLVRADAAGVRQSREAAAGELARIKAEISAAVRAISPALPQDLSLPGLEAWLERREKALDTRTALKQAERDFEAARACGEETRKQLAEALDSAGVPYDADASIHALMAAAQAALDRETELKALRRAIEERERDATARELSSEQAAAAERDWSRRWMECCSGCWLGDRGSLPSLAAVREILEALEGLGPIVEKRASLADRIRKMEHDQRRFETEVEAAARALGVGTQSLPGLDRAAALMAAYESARAAETSRAAETCHLDEALERRRKLAQLQELHARRKGEMLQHFGAASLAEVSAKLQGIEQRRELQGRALEIEGEILDALGMPSIGEAERKLEELDRGALESQLSELTARFEDQDRRAYELFAEQSKASDRVEAVGGDDAAARLEERRRTVFVEIEEAALRHMRLRLGLSAAEHALRIYRDEHRSSMMTRASDAFRTISRGAYTGLATRPEKEHEVLIAVGANDTSKLASALSKGARFQLYLALRVAGYHEFVRSREPLPFLADDIMETFDDFRAEEAFRLLAAMAEAGQVIYLTHHRHLCDIARRACPGVQVHELTGHG